MINFVGWKHRFDPGVEIILTVSDSIRLSGNTLTIKEKLKERGFKFDGTAWSVKPKDESTAVKCLRWIHRQNFVVLSNQDELKNIL